jgi:hypothetical protein
MYCWLWLITKCQVVSYVYKPYLSKSPNLLNLKIYLFGESKLPLELPTPVVSVTKVPIKDSREARLIFIRTSDTRSDLPTTLGSISILPTEGPRVWILFSLELSMPHHNFWQYTWTYIYPLTAPQTLTLSSKRHQRPHYSPLNSSRGTQDLTEGFRCHWVLWILHSEDPTPFIFLPIREGNLQGKSFKNLIARSPNVEGVKWFPLGDSFHILFRTHD